MVSADFTGNPTHPPLSETLDATGQNALWQFDNGFEQQVTGVYTQSHMFSDFLSPYAGTVAFECERNLSTEDGANMRCSTNWLYNARIGEGYNIGLGMHARSTQFPKPVYITQKYFLPSFVRVNNKTLISHRNGKFENLPGGIIDDDYYTVSVPSIAGLYVGF